MCCLWESEYFFILIKKCYVSLILIQLPEDKKNIWMFSFPFWIHRPSLTSWFVPQHQQQVVQAMERAKQVTMGELNASIGVRGLPPLPHSVCTLSSHLFILPPFSFFFEANIPGPYLIFTHSLANLLKNGLGFIGWIKNWIFGPENYAIVGPTKFFSTNLKCKYDSYRI